MTMVLITGGDGFLGRAVARRALARGWVPVILDRQIGPLPEDLADAPARVVDLRDPDSLAQAVRAHPPGAVVHLAAYGAGADGLYAGAARDPGAAVDVNVRGLVNLLQAVSAGGARSGRRAPRVVLASSTTVYGPAEDYPPGPVAEHVPLQPRSVYGATKAAAELVARPLAAALELPVTAVRLPLVYGPGRWYGGSQRALVQFVRDVAQGRPGAIEAWTREADWVHVVDAADALLAGVAGAAAPAYNVVGHRGSLHSLACAVAAHATAPAHIQPTGDGDPGLPLTDDTLARRDLGFQPSYADPAAGAADYVRAERSATS
jgi:nucleoside-diphosphate-sugar epimerase